jgi:hypothetical protein
MLFLFLIFFHSGKGSILPSGAFSESQQRRAVISCFYGKTVAVLLFFLTIARKHYDGRLTSICFY